MPEYLPPGVYLEEIAFKPRSIEGVSTSTTGLIRATSGVGILVVGVLLGVVLAFVIRALRHGLIANDDRDE